MEKEEIESEAETQTEPELQVESSDAIKFSVNMWIFSCTLFSIGILRINNLSVAASNK